MSDIARLFCTVSMNLFPVAIDTVPNEDKQYRRRKKKLSRRIRRSEEMEAKEREKATKNYEIGTYSNISEQLSIHTKLYEM